MSAAPALRAVRPFATAIGGVGRLTNRTTVKMQIYRFQESNKTKSTTWKIKCVEKRREL
jgi:hypothetical protein